jgi:GAF domain-containing protein
VSRSLHPAERTAILLGAQSRARELMQLGAGLPAVLEHLCGVVEDLSDRRSVAAILVLEGERLRNVSSPSLPADDLASDFKGLWSQPIRSREGRRVLGTFGIYFREQREPTSEERETVEFLASTAALAIEGAKA